MRSCRQAFSLLELLLALGTMAATLLLVVALAISVAGRHQQVQETPVGLVAAESILNQFVYNVQANGPYQDTFFSKPTTASYVSDTVQMDRVSFAYAIDLEYLTDTSGVGIGGNSLGGLNHLMKIKVRVTWTMGNGPNQGRHTAELSRILHEDS